MFENMQNIDFADLRLFAIARLAAVGRMTKEVTVHT
jgi:hypothetical protein